MDDLDGSETTDLQREESASMLLLQTTSVRHDDSNRTKFLQKAKKQLLNTVKNNKEMSVGVHLNALQKSSQFIKKQLEA